MLTYTSNKKQLIVPDKNDVIKYRWLMKGQYTFELTNKIYTSHLYCMTSFSIRPLNLLLKKTKKVHKKSASYVMKTRDYPSLFLLIPHFYDDIERLSSSSFWNFTFIHVAIFSFALQFCANWIYAVTQNIWFGFRRLHSY